MEGVIVINTYPSFFNHYTFSGTHREVGRQHGETLREELRRHLEIIYNNTKRNSGISPDRALILARKYKPYVEKYAPHFMEEIIGLSEGGNISEDEAMLLQVRQEVVNSARYGSPIENAPECTAFAVGAPYTSNGKMYSGQNSDMYDNFRPIMSVVTFKIPKKPDVMMAIPAGQLSFMGMNSEGISVNCNMLHCKGWQEGFPRYLMSRLILEERTFEDACQKVNIPERASQRNILICDSEGHIANFETTPTRISRKNCTTGAFAHANHFCNEDMLFLEESNERESRGSHNRQGRMEELFEENKGRIDNLSLHTFLGDHQRGDDSVCMHPTEYRQYHTIVSIVNNLTDRVMEVAPGNPCCNEYAIYEFK